MLWASPCGGHRQGLCGRWSLRGPPKGVAGATPDWATGSSVVALRTQTGHPTGPKRSTGVVVSVYGCGRVGRTQGPGLLQISPALVPGLPPDWAGGSPVVGLAQSAVCLPGWAVKVFSGRHRLGPIRRAGHQTGHFVSSGSLQRRMVRAGRTQGRGALVTGRSSGPQPPWGGVLQTGHRLGHGVCSCGLQWVRYGWAVRR